MLLPSVGLPTVLLTGASLLVILTSHVFQAPDHSTSKRNGPDADVPFTVPQLNTPASKVAVSFGSKTALHDSLLNAILVNSSHHKRDQWSDAVAEGRRLYDTILSRRALPSPFFAKRWLTGFYPEDSNRDADKLGWQLYTNDAMPDHPDHGSVSSGDDTVDSEEEDEQFDPPHNETPEGYEDPFDDLHIPQGDKNENWIAYQNINFRNCYASNRQATMGNFGNYYNVPGKTIVAAFNFSPAFKLKQRYERAGRRLPRNWARGLPFVSRWSDVTWIIWVEISRQVGRPPGNLKHVFRHHIITQSTRDIIAKAVNSETPYWPGRKFTPDDEQYMALLATAHGKGVFNLLTQHPAEFGSRNIESITVFTTAPHDSRDHLLFTFTD